MSREKQIEEMARMLCGMKNGCDKCMFNKVNCNERSYAEEFYNAGYRKQSEGEWVRYSTTMMECSVCKRHTAYHRYDFCPRCGAKMKGGAE